MAWAKTAAGREQDRERYQDPQYVKNRAVVLRRAGGRCEQCGRRGRIQVDHKVSLAVRVDHSPGNLWGLCEPCHRAKTGRDARQAPRKPRDPEFDNSQPNTRW